MPCPAQHLFGLLKIAADADLTLCTAGRGTAEKAVCRSGEGLAAEVSEPQVLMEKRKVIPPAAARVGPAALERCQRCLFLALLQNLPSQLACYPEH